MSLILDFGGEIHHLEPTQPFVIGREGDLAVEDNPFLHRRFLEIRHDNGLWWLINVGSVLSATIGDSSSGLQAWLAPGGRMPMVLETTVVRFTAGPTHYEIQCRLHDAPYVHADSTTPDDGSTTIGRVVLTPDQKLAVVVLAEAALRRGTSGSADVPSSASAARRLGWTPKKFEKKIDNLCEKFAAVGVRGLKGSPGNLASSRRSRLIEYALAARIVTTGDLALLEAHAADGIVDEP